MNEKANVSTEPQSQIDFSRKSTDQSAKSPLPSKTNIVSMNRQEPSAVYAPSSYLPPAYTPTSYVAPIIDEEPSTENEPAYTEDFLLGGRVFLRQPATGYRVAIDPIFLAASIDAHAGDTILDVGCGVGAASLCLATRCPTVRIAAVELQRENVRYAVDNINLNQLRARVEVLQGDLLKPPPRLAAGTFSHVMANPPFLEPHQGRPSPNAQKLASNHEHNADLDQWAKFCLLMVKPRGTVTFIHRADRLDQILAYFTGKLGDILVYPLWPNEYKSAKRVLIRGIKNANGPLKMMRGLVLHGPDGKFTKEAEAILRQGEGLSLSRE